MTTLLITDSAAGSATRSRRPEESGPAPAAAARAVAVVSGGPLALAGLSLTAPVALARRWPDRLPGRARTLGWAVTAFGVAAPWVYASAVRPWLRDWGSTPEERGRRYPGDGAGTPLVRSTRALTVHAPAAEVWRWLVQIGQDKGGFYSYDWLENLAGCRLHSADRVHEEWQQVQAGDPLTIFPGHTTRLAVVEPPRVLVIENWGTYAVEEVDARTCRLVARSHTDGWLPAAAYVLAIELPHAIMERRMLLGIKRRAEAAVR
jgi:hypothetical protein